MSEEEEQGGGDGWLISYADLMTLLFAAFVVLYGITPQGESEEILAVTASIRESFVEIPDIIGDLDMIGPSESGKRVFNAVKLDSANPRIKKFNVEEKSVSLKQEEKQSIDIMFKSVTRHTDGLQQSLRQATSIVRHELGFTLTLAGTVYFKRGESQMDSRGRSLLSAIRKDLSGYKGKIIIEGHTRTGLESRNMDNMALAGRRANHVKSLLNNEGGKVYIAALGGLRPSSKDKDKEALNQRVEIRFEGSDGR